MSKLNLQEQAAENLKDHKYTCLAKTDSLEAWRCMEPGTSSYAFDILITRFGIAVVGDIGSLTFRVGSNYGMPFLAGKDVAYYIHSKLEHQCRETQYNEDSFHYYFKQRLSVYLQDYWSEVERLCGKKIKLPAWVFDEGIVSKVPLKAIRKLTNKIHESIPLSAVSTTKYPYNLREMAWDYTYSFPEDEEEAREFINKYFEDEHDCPSMTQASTSLMCTLYMVNHAAKEIMKIREAGNV